jgi:general secretion pathway protein K
MLQPPPTGAPPANGSIRAYEVLGSRVLVSVQNERGKIDLNTAQPELLKGLFQSVGESAEKSDELVAAIEDWRDDDDLPRLHGAETREYVAAGRPAGAKNGLFDSVDELQQVFGMTPELFRRVAPALTVYSRSSRIDASVAPPEALRAMGGLSEEEIQSLVSERDAPADDEEDAGEGGVAPTVRRFRGMFMIRSLAQTQRGAVFVREAVTQLTGSPEEPFKFLAWREGNVAQFQSAAAAAQEPPRQ